MSITLGNVGAYLAIIGFTAGLIRVLVVAPLQKDIESNQKTSKAQLEVIQKESNTNLSTVRIEVEGIRKSFQKESSIQLEALRTQIEELRKAIDSLSKAICLIENNISSVRERVVSCEVSTKQAHKRLDSIELQMYGASFKGYKKGGA